MLKISVFICMCVVLDFSGWSVTCQTDPKAALSPYAVVYFQALGINGFMPGFGSLNLTGKLEISLIFLKKLKKSCIESIFS